MFRTTAACLLAAGALFAAGCGDDDDSGDSGSTTTAAAETKALTDVDPRSSKPNIAGGNAPIDELMGNAAGDASNYWADVFQKSGLTYEAPDASGTAGTLSVPVVHFGVGTGELLGAMQRVGVDVVGVDYRVPLDVAAGRIGAGVPLQGNLDPALLAAPWPVLEAAVRDVLARGRVAPAHVFNLGHGVPPETDPTVLTRVVELVHEAGA